MKIENPYRSGAYHFTVATLMALGINKTHKFSTFATKLKEVWQKANKEGWHDFEHRKAHSKVNAKDLDGRILQNCRVLQRIKDYGRPLLKAGAVIDLPRDSNGVLQVRLNSHSRKPLKPGRSPKPDAKETQPAKSKTPTKRLPSKGKKSPPRRSVKVSNAIPSPSTTHDAATAGTDGRHANGG